MSYVLGIAICYQACDNYTVNHFAESEMLNIHCFPLFFLAGVFDEGDYWDIEVEYCKNSPDDILARYTIHNRGKMADTIHVMPILWFRNVWSWGDACDVGIY